MQNLSSAAVVIGALRVKCSHRSTSCHVHNKYWKRHYISNCVDLYQTGLVWSGSIWIAILSKLFKHHTKYLALGHGKYLRSCMFIQRNSNLNEMTGAYFMSKSYGTKWHVILNSILNGKNLLGHESTMSRIFFFLYL